MQKYNSRLKCDNSNFFFIVSYMFLKKNIKRLIVLYLTQISKRQKNNKVRS